MQAFASPVEKGASYPTDGQGVCGKKRRTPLHENALGLRLTVVSPEQPVILSPVAQTFTYRQQPQLTTQGD
jgi:hypothetical protein